MKISRNHSGKIYTIVFIFFTASLSSACSGSSNSSKTAESYLETITSESSTSLSIAGDVLEQAGKDIENCDDIKACVNGVITMGYECDTPPALTIVNFESGQWALREGKAPLMLATNYTFDELMQLCL
jgi:hypothetical protein